MTRVSWHDLGQKIYETGVDRGVLYPTKMTGGYDKGVPWNGLSSVGEKPSGAESNPIYADNIKYLNLISIEEFGATVEAYTYPDEFAKCDGSVSPTNGMYISQQPRQMFGLSYRTLMGNDTQGTEFGYKIHLVYGAMAAPTEKGYGTVNESPEAITFSWEVTTTPVDVPGFKPTAHVTIDSTKTDPIKLKDLEDKLYGTAGTDAELPTPEEVVAILRTGVTTVTPIKPTQLVNAITIPVVVGVTYWIANEIVTGVVNITEDVLVVATANVGYRFPPVVDNDWLFEHQ